MLFHCFAVHTIRYITFEAQWYPYWQTHKHKAAGRMILSPARRLTIHADPYDIAIYIPQLTSSNVIWPHHFPHLPSLPPFSTENVKYKYWCSFVDSYLLFSSQSLRISGTNTLGHIINAWAVATYCSFLFCRLAALSLGFFCPAAAFFCAFSRSFSRWFPPMCHKTRTFLQWIETARR